MKYINQLVMFNGFNAYSAMSDPFQNAHRAAERKAAKDAAADENVARAKRIVEAEKARKPKPAAKPFVPSKAPWGPQ